MKKVDIIAKLKELVVGQEVKITDHNFKDRLFKVTNICNVSGWEQIGLQCWDGHYPIQLIINKFNIAPYNIKNIE